MPSQLISVVPDPRYIVLQLQIPCMDVDACEEMEMLLREQIEAGCRPVILDLTRAKFLPSMAIGSLVAARKRLAECGTHLTIVGLAPSIQRALDIARLTATFSLADSLEEAVASQPAG